VHKSHALAAMPFNLKANLRKGQGKPSLVISKRMDAALPKLPDHLFAGNHPIDRFPEGFVKTSLYYGIYHLLPPDLTLCNSHVRFTELLRKG